MKKYTTLLTENEEWLMHRILNYAEKHDFHKYTSTLPEAWRLSIQGLSNSIIAAVKQFNNKIPELHPDDQYVNDPVSKFGLEEAIKHRQRGTGLGMFLGLMKYYKECYLDLIDISNFTEAEKKQYKSFTTRCFDRIEIAYCIEWTAKSDANLLEELQESNRKITNEKNKYLTIFESSYIPTIYLDDKLTIVNINHAAATFFSDHKNAGAMYYNDASLDVLHQVHKKILKYIK